MPSGPWAHDVLVLCYHALSPSWDDPIATTPARFEAQIARLIRRGWHATTFAEAVLEPPRRRTLAITFDDGFRSTYELGGGILERLGVPATVFVPTAFADSGRLASWPHLDRWLGTRHEQELEPASWDQLRRLRDAGWEIGSHTVTHPHLTELTVDRVRAELGESKASIEHRLGEACRSIAYPYSDVDPAVARLAKRCGFEAGATLLPIGDRRDAMRFPRVFISGSEGRMLHRLHLLRGVRRLQSTAAWSQARDRPHGASGAS